MIAKLAYSGAKGTGQNAGADNLNAMFGCMKKVARGFKWEAGQGEEEFVSLADSPHSVAGIKGPMPCYGVCIHMNKVVLIRYCPDRSSDIPPEENLKSGDIMKSSGSYEPVKEVLGSG